MKKNASALDLCKAFIDQEKYPVVLCDLDHTVLYVNAFGVKAFKGGKGEELVGKSIFECHNDNSRRVIQNGVNWLAESVDHNVVFEYHAPFDDMDVYMIALRDRDGELVGYFEKHLPGYHDAPVIQSL